MRHELLVAVISGLTASIVPTIGIIIVCLQRRAQFGGVDQKFASINQRFDEMILFWREELHGFEERLAARLRRLEEK